MRSLSTLVLMFAVAASATAANPPQTYDLVIYGGTSAGVAAAVQAARMDHSVILISPAEHLGGLTSSGLGATDSGSKSAIGGISHEFYARIHDHYRQSEAWEEGNQKDFSGYDPNAETMWVFEPHVAEQIFEDFIAESEVPVVRDAWIDRDSGVTMKNGRIVAITTLDGKTYHGKMFIDATYEGDLMAVAGVSYTTGRESNEKYDESLNGVQPDEMVYHHFVKNVSPYIVPGDPSSGLLPHVHGDPRGEKGSGDHRVQAYCYRMCMTDAPENRVDWPKPEGYDPIEYELLLRNFDAGDHRPMFILSRMPNRKTDTNNKGPFSTDNIGKNYDYPEASYKERAEIALAHERYQKGLMWTLAHNPRVPEKIQNIARTWGLSADEFQDNGNWPYKLYIREARRMLSEYVMTEHDIRRTRKTPQPIGLGSYSMDSHNTQRYVTEEGYVQNEGDVQVSPGGPYQIAYPAITPKPEECENLLVPVCLSASHIAYGSIRMEPVFMILGQSAATAALQAIDNDVSVQEIDYGQLRERLLADGQVLVPPGGLPPAKPPVVPLDPEKLPGVVIDDSEAELNGNWSVGNVTGPFVGKGYRHNSDASETKSASFSAALPAAGKYEVRVSYPAYPNRATNTPVTIHHADGEKTVRINQRERGEVQGLFHSVGTYRFAKDEPAVVVIGTQDANGHVLVDAVQFVPVK